METKLDFPTKEGYSKEDIRKVQEKLLEMADIVIGILEKHNIPYALTYGTFLGAVRHQGFIPWDDDLDLMLFDQEYDEALRVLREELPADLIVHDRETDPIFWPSWSRVRDLNSTTHASMWIDDNNYKYQGINLDLYKLIATTKKNVALDRQREIVQYLVRKNAVKVLPDAQFVPKFDQAVRKYYELLNQTDIENGDEKVYYTASGLKIELKEEDIFPLKRYSFEGRSWLGMANELFLKQRYGDYMAIPPYEERLAHYDGVEFLSK